MNRKSFAKNPSLSLAGKLARIAATAFVVAVFTQGCLAGGITKGRAEFYEGRIAEAAATLAQAKDSKGKDRVLAMLEYGSVAHDAGDYAGSSATLLEAADKIEANDIVSITQATGSVVANDTIRTFKPESFENVLVHAYLMMDFMMLDDWTAARVEAKRALRALDGMEDDDLERDPFTRYLAGLAFDAMGDYSDAYIEYVRVIEAEPGFAPLLRDLHRIARREGRPEASKWKQAYTDAGGEITDDSPNNVIAIIGAGRGPYKVELNTFIPPNANRFVIPDYRSSGSISHHAVVSFGDARMISMALTDTDPIAFLALKKRMAKIIAKELLRVAAKEAVVQTIEEQDPFVGLAARILVMSTEAADTRGWETLPRFFGIGLARVPAGTYDARIDFYDIHNNSVGYSTSKNIVVRDDRRTVFSARSIY